MTPEQKRIAIAEACGWRGISEQFLVGYAPWRTEPYADRVNACPIADLDCIPLDPLPDYFNDLNAMHEAEKVLNGYRRTEYIVALRKIIVRDMDTQPHQDPDTGTLLDIYFYGATAAQRAEAFGLTLKLW